MKNFTRQFGIAGIGAALLFAVSGTQAANARIKNGSFKFNLPAFAPASFVFNTRPYMKDLKLANN